MKYFLTIIMIIFLGCASQMAPKGGPLDQIGPILIKVSHNEKDNIFNTDEKIIFTFDEFLDPLSVVNSVQIFNFDDYTLQVRGKKVILKPNNNWPNTQQLKVNFSRKISDYHGNIMESPIKYVFLDDHHLNNKNINGLVINSNSNLYTVVLLQRKNNEFHLYDITETDIKGNFSFNYLDNTKYTIAAIYDSFDNLEEDFQTKKYGLISDDYIDLSIQDSAYIYIRIDEPAEKLSIISFNQINNNFGHTMLSNGLTKPFFISKNLNQDDSIRINLNLQNRFEEYSTDTFIAKFNNIIDTISPKLLNTRYDKNKFLIEFDEPISRVNKSPIIYYKIDTIIYDMDYKFYDSFTIELENDIYGDIYLHNIFDSFSNQNPDTLKVYKEEKDIKDVVGGNIYGNVKNIQNYPIVVNAQSSNKENSYYEFIDSLGNFSFINIAPGFYTFNAYEIVGEYSPKEYYNGSWTPYKKAARFSFYTEPLEVRAHWDIKDLIIEMR